jgi:hypothetical protein
MTVTLYQFDDIFIVDVDGISVSMNISERPDTSYINSFTIVDGQLVIDMNVAKEVHRNILRTERKKYFEILDQQYLEAHSRSKNTTLIKEKQQYLRDITEDPRINSATTIDELKQVSIVEWTPIVVKNLDSI